MADVHMRSEVTGAGQITFHFSQKSTQRPVQLQRLARVQESPAQPSTKQTESIIQEVPRFTRNPGDGDRTTAIESRGGEAATQMCGGPIEITNRAGECRELEYDKDFLQLIQTEGLTCAREAGQAAFGFTPTRIKLRTGEGQVSLGRYSSNGKLSTHSIGRALDIFEIDIYNGASHNSILMHGSYMDRAGHRTFYARFGECWQKVVRSVQGSLAGSCGGENVGCLGYTYNSAHWDHMHISLPPVDRNRKNHNINCT